MKYKVNYFNMKGKSILNSKLNLNDGTITAINALVDFAKKEITLS